MRVIGLAGLKGSGKDAFANRLSAELTRLGVWCWRQAFAEHLKDVLKFAMLLSDAQLSDPRLKEELDPRWGVSPRQAMRQIGEAVRGIAPDFWVRRLDLSVRATVEDVAQRQTACLVVTDVRNDVEAMYVKRQGRLILIRRSGALFDGHSTEEMGTRLASFFDLMIDNSGTLADLDGHAAAAAERLLPWLKSPVAFIG